MLPEFLKILVRSIRFLAPMPTTAKLSVPRAGAKVGRVFTFRHGLENLWRSENIAWSS